MISRLAVAVLLASALLPVAARAQTGKSAVNVSRSTGASTSPGCAVDDADTVHLAWADNPDSEDTAVQFVFYARSVDGGATFEAPRRISAGVAEQARAREIRVVTGSNGVVAVAWW